MADDFAILANGDGMVRVNLALGNIVSLDFFGVDRSYSPLHTAHWAVRQTKTIDSETAPIERNLTGDFLSAPFGSLARPDYPNHGPPANSRWSPIENGRKLRLKLDATVSGATVEKEIALGSGPFLYQVNRFVGGQGDLPVATHPMFDMEPGNRMFFSPKRMAKTAETPMIPDRHRLQYPASSADISAFPGRTGAVDLTRYPDESGADDFVQMAEMDNSDIGWTAILAKDSITVVLKDPRSLPVTQLWISNGVRQDGPRSGSHLNVLGLMDACVPFDDDTPFGIELKTGGTTEIRHVIGSFPRPQSWDEVKSIEVIDAALQIT